VRAIMQIIIKIIIYAIAMPVATERFSAFLKNTAKVVRLIMTKNSATTPKISARRAPRLSVLKSGMVLINWF
jgi:spore maturation protein CgeB